MAGEFKRLTGTNHLERAFRIVEANSLQSSSELTKEQVRKFKSKQGHYIKSISQQLNRGTFEFDQSVGYPKKKSSGSSRGIVSTTPKNKVVQRALLEVLQGTQKLRPFFDTPNSFGAVEGRSVPEAVTAAQKAIRNGATFFYKSDIRDFFPTVGRQSGLDRVASVIDDARFMNVLREALITELSNLEELGEDRNLFPLGEDGVAQGNCLSALFGNIYLFDFDQITNTADVVCIRFLDDFIIFGPTAAAVQAVARKAHKELKRLGLKAHEPKDKTDKAKFGSTKEGVEFLGCFIHSDFAKPANKSIGRLKESIEGILEQSLALARRGGSDIQFQRATEAQVKSKVANKCIGWWGQYQFCEMPDLRASISRDISEMLDHYDGELAKIKARLPVLERARIQGILPNQGW